MRTKDSTILLERTLKVKFFCIHLKSSYKNITMFLQYNQLAPKVGKKENKGVSLLLQTAACYNGFTTLSRMGGNSMTFSIVARDPQKGELGIAVQSKFLGVGAVVPWAKAGVGAIATQSWANTSYDLYVRFKGTNMVSVETSGLYIRRMPLIAPAGTWNMIMPLRELWEAIEPKKLGATLDCSPNASPSALIN
jgi:hypothetical protein